METTGRLTYFTSRPTGSHQHYGGVLTRQKLLHRASFGSTGTSSPGSGGVVRTVPQTAYRLVSKPLCAIWLRSSCTSGRYTFGWSPANVAGFLDSRVAFFGPRLTYWLPSTLVSFMSSVFVTTCPSVVIPSYFAHRQVRGLSIPIDGPLPVAKRMREAAPIRNVFSQLCRLNTVRTPRTCCTSSASG